VKEGVVFMRDKNLSLRGAIDDFAARRGLSTRLLILFIVLFAVAVTLAPPTQHYFAQRAQISALEADLASNRARLEAARAELELWRDPDYIRSQARSRLHFVLPGERQYIVLGVESVIAEGSTTPVNEDFPLGVPWYSRVISSITSVGLTEKP
jgi:cell division protein FtsB